MRRAYPAIAFVVALGAFIGLSASPHTGGDPSRDILIARDCVELGQCVGIGPPTTVEGLYQGVGWHVFVAGVWAVSPDLRALQWALWVALALACAGWTLAIQRRRRIHEALAAGALLLVWILVSGDTTRIWNSSLVPAFGVLATVGIWRMRDESSPALAIGAGFVIGWGAGVHLAMFALVPALVIVAARRHSWRHPSLAMLGLTAGVILSGPDAALSNAAFVSPKIALLAASGLAFAWILGTLARTRYAARIRDCPEVLQDTLTMGAIIAPWTLAALVLVARNHTIRTDYAHPIAAAATLGLAVAVSASAKRLVSESRTPALLCAAVLALAAITVRPARAEPGWSLDTLEAVAAHAYASRNHAAVRQRVQSPRCGQLIDGLAMFSTARSGPASSTTALAVLPATNGDDERLGSAMIRIEDAWVREIPSRVSWLGAEICIGELCQEWEPDPRELHAAGLAARAYPQAFPGARREGPVEWHIPIEAGDERVFSLPVEGCFEFVQERGRHETRRNDAGMLRVQGNLSCADTQFFPCIVESLPEEHALRGALREVGGRR